MTNSEKSKAAAQDKVARLRAEQARTERRRVVIAASAVGAVVVLVAVLVVARLAARYQRAGRQGTEMERLEDRHHLGRPKQGSAAPDQRLRRK